MRRSTFVVTAGMIAVAVTVAACRGEPEETTRPQATASEHEFDEAAESHAYLAAERLLRLRALGIAAAAWEAVCRLPEGQGALSDEEVASASLASNLRWELYSIGAQAPVAVSIDSWREDLPRGTPARLSVTLINDTDGEEPVDLRLHAVLADGSIGASSRMHRETIPAGGRVPVSLEMMIPNAPEFVLVAEAKVRNPFHPSALSRRKIGFPGAGAAIPDPPYRTACCQVG